MNTNEFFKRFSSNTLAGTSNQTYFDSPEISTGYAFYRVFKSGKFNYSLYFTNTLDGTFADGSFTKCNYPCGNWKIHGLWAIIGKSTEEILNGGGKSVKLTFDGQEELNVLPDAKFCTDPVELCVSDDEYLCVKMVFSGEKIPCHYENVILTYRADNASGEGASPNKYVPLPSMVGAEREVKSLVAFWGDSITQGIGCPDDSYANYCAVCAKILGADYSFWNLGIGFGRGGDAATNGAWADKVKHCQTVIVCYGVNDIFKVPSYEEIRNSLDKIVEILQGKKVIFQTIPPFDFTGEFAENYFKLNNYIKTEIAKKVYAVFDDAPLLSDPATPAMAKFGGHPNEEGAKIWGERLAAFLKDKL